MYIVLGCVKGGKAQVLRPVEPVGLSTNNFEWRFVVALDQFLLVLVVGYGAVLSP